MRGLFTRSVTAPAKPAEHDGTPHHFAMSTKSPVTRVAAPLAAWPNVLQHGEPVSVSEVHAGTPLHYMVSKGVVRVEGPPETAADLDSRLSVVERMTHVFAGNDVDVHVFVVAPAEGLPVVVDVFAGFVGNGRWLTVDEVTAVCEALAFPRVPVLGHFPYSPERVAECAAGREVTVQPEVERTYPGLGRVLLATR